MKNYDIKKGIGWAVLFVLIYTVFFVTGRVDAKEYTLGVNGRIPLDPTFFSEQIAVLRRATEKDRITIIISSEGGSTYTARMLIAAMKASKGHVRTVAFGYAASAAAAIALAGDEFRYMDDTKILFHSVRQEINNKQFSSPMLDRALWLHLYEEIAQEVLFTSKELESMLKYKDVVLSGEELTRRLKRGRSKLVEYSDENPYAYD